MRTQQNHGHEVSGTDVGIPALLSTNPAFRRLWFAQLISQGGDWFNHVAVMHALMLLTGSGKAVGLSFVLRLLPAFLMAPVAGLVADRFDRKRVMVVSDIARGVSVPLFIIAVRALSPSLIYAALAFHVLMSALFEPAKNALLPSITKRGELLAANALSAATWSIMLSVGSFTGGLVISWLGVEVAFVVDALSFLLSAAILLGVKVPESHRETAQRSATAMGSGTKRRIDDLFLGLAYALRRPYVLACTLVKAGVGTMGGVLLLFAVLAHGPMAAQYDPAFVIAVLYAARGVGTGLGPLLARRFIGQRGAALNRTIGYAFLQSSVFFVLFGTVEGLAAATVLLVIGHMGTAAAWVYSTVALQLEVDENVRGRVFAVELGAYTLSYSLFIYATGVAVDDLGWDPLAVAKIIGAVLAIPGVLWLIAMAKLHRPT